MKTSSLDNSRPICHIPCLAVWNLVEEYILQSRAWVKHIHTTYLSHIRYGIPVSARQSHMTFADSCENLTWCVWIIGCKRCFTAAKHKHIEDPAQPKPAFKNVLDEGKCSILCNILNIKILLKFVRKLCRVFSFGSTRMSRQNNFSNTGHCKRHLWAQQCRYNGGKCVPSWWIN